MAITVVNAEAERTDNFADPSTYTLTMTPTTGNSLLVAIYMNGVTFTSLSDSGGNTWVQDFQTTGRAANDMVFYRCQTIGTVPTTLSLDTSANSQPWVAVMEVSGLDATPLNETVAGQSLGLSQTSHSLAYTTAEAGELVFAICDLNSGSSGNSGASGTVVLNPTVDSRFFAYKEVASAETGQIDLTTVDSETIYASLVSYQAAAAAATGASSLIGSNLINSGTGR